jgi:hypothetical protein
MVYKLGKTSILYIFPTLSSIAGVVVPLWGIDASGYLHTTHCTNGQVWKAINPNGAAQC